MSKRSLRIVSATCILGANGLAWANSEVVGNFVSFLTLLVCGLLAFAATGVGRG